MKIIIDNFKDCLWDSFVVSAQNSTFYHKILWRKVINMSFGHRCYYLAAIDDHGDWQGVLPLTHMHSSLFGNFLVSVPFVNYGGLLYKNAAAAYYLIEEAERLRGSCGANYVELRHLARGVEGLPTKQHKVTMILSLAKDVASQWKLFNSKLRNQIRKAEKSSLEVMIGHLELLDGFYEVFARNMRDLGTPVYAKHFFHNVLETFPDSTRIFSVKYHGHVIAAGVALWFRDSLEIPWASSINDYKSLCPNNMLYWAGIRFAIENGFSKFDFGRSTPNEGTYNFKKQWGAMPVPLYWQYLMNESNSIPELTLSNPRYQMSIRMWKHLPVPLTKILGPLIVRNIP